MDPREEILARHSKAQCNKIVAWVGQSQARFNVLLSLFLGGEYRVAQRAAWPVNYCVQAYPFLIKTNFKKLIDNLNQPGIHPTVKRNTIRLMQYVDIPKGLQGKVMDCCFSCVVCPTEAVATKAFALTVLGKLALVYPDILPEIKLIIEGQLPYEKASFKSRAKRIMKL